MGFVSCLTGMLVERLLAYPAKKQMVNTFPHIAEKCSVELLTIKIAKNEDKGEYAKGVEQTSNQ